MRNTNPGSFHDAKLVVSLLLEPVKAAPDIDDALPHRIQRAPDVGRHRVVGPLDLCRHADIVIWHREPQHGNSQQIKGLTKADVRHGV